MRTNRRYSTSWRWYKKAQKRSAAISNESPRRTVMYFDPAPDEPDRHLFASRLKGEPASKAARELRREYDWV